ncbi:MAG: alpha/beta hydrolase [Euryarchaeota archaeon]|nr:alpha/beta hydrolase [Euryarchaeota archaeon]
MTLNRRQFIGTTGAALAGAGLLGRNATARSERVPQVTTFDHFDNDANLTDGNTETNYETSGDVPGIDAEHVADLTVLVHGWRPTQNDEEAREDNAEKFAEANRELGGSGYDGTVIGYEWDSHRGDSLDSGWADANRIAERNGPKLAQFVRDYRDQRPNAALRIASHSLGTLVLVHCLEELDEDWTGQHPPITTAHPFGSAVDHDRPTSAYPETRTAIEEGVGAVHNYHSRLDSVLKAAYEPRETDRALGRHGADSDHEAPANYIDHDVTDTVGLDHEGYLENASDLMVSHMG